MNLIDIGFIFAAAVGLFLVCATVAVIWGEEIKWGEIVPVSAGVVSFILIVIAIAVLVYVAVAMIWSWE